MGINVLSLFDGMSCGQIALERANIEVDNYYASEIKKHAIKLTKEHYPNTIHIGDVTKVSYKDGVLYTENGEFNVGKIDLLIGGSPCQNFSIASVTQLGLQGEKSRLFYEYLRLLREVEPTYFLLENVKMKKESEQQLNRYLEVKGIHINSNLVSYQNRPRIYWTNIKSVTIPEDRNVNFQDYKETDPEECRKYMLNRTPSRIKMWSNGNGRKCGHVGICDNKTFDSKINCLTRKQDRSPNSGLIACDDFARFLTRREIEQAQTLPIGYCDSVSYNQMQDLCGDGWTVDIIAHIFSFMDLEEIKPKEIIEEKQLEFSV